MLNFIELHKETQTYWVHGKCSKCGDHKDFIAVSDGLHFRDTTFRCTRLGCGKQYSLNKAGTKEGKKQ